MFTLNIYTPEKFFLETQADSLTCLGLDGEICILQNHMSMILAIKSGVMRINTGGEIKRIETGAGFAEINSNQVDMFVSFCVYEEEANAEKQAAIQREKEKQDSISEHKHNEIVLARQVSEFGKVKKNI